jgi:hypothetical protein
MGKRFEVGVGTQRDMLVNQPPQYKHLNVLYSLFAVRVGADWFPASCWCDFAGIMLFRWYEAVWRLSQRQTRAARLPFFYTYELWLRRTPKHWWKVNKVERYVDHCDIVGEELVIPEEVEAASITAIRQFLKAALNANQWKEDCTALEALLNDTAGYLRGLDAGTIPVPRFLTVGSGYKRYHFRGQEGASR